ncbi:MAG: NAD(P)/FAD-dependent oxidoreductase [Chloroflexi bacterium]|nr:NAD(P)/FAD-dependent oxidoreductase [Chloroflexota bacterium]
MDSDLGPLEGKKTVAIIGGGPAGSSCAIMLRRIASRNRIPLRVVVFEPKDFAVEGNICVGVLSPPFQKLLSQLDLVLPQSIIQRRVKGYMLHSKREIVFLEDKPKDGESTLVTDRADLDSFLLQSARTAGAAVMDDTVVDLRPGPDKVLVVSSGGGRVLADVVVGAFGLDSDALSIFEAHVPGYRRPSITKSILTEITVGEKAVNERLDDTIHALLIDQLDRVEFGALTPKRDHVTVNIAGDNITDDDLDAFLRLPWSRKLLAEATFKEPRYYNAFPSGPAQSIYRDRIVTIGNTSGLLRPLKGKGINTSLITGMLAAQTMMEVGISQTAFDDFYRRCHDLTSEFSYGIFLRRLYRLSQKLNVLDGVLALSRREPLLYQAFYDMVSGEGSYREIIWRSARPALIAKIIFAIAKYRLLRR